MPPVPSGKEENAVNYKITQLLELINDMLPEIKASIFNFTIDDFLIHEADPWSRPVVVTTFTRGVCTSVVRSHFSKYRYFVLLTHQATVFIFTLGVCTSVTLKSPELLIFFQDFFFQMTKQDLLHPTPIRVQTMYAQILTEFGFQSAISAELPLTGGPQEGPVGYLEHPEMFRDILGLGKLAASVK